MKTGLSGYRALDLTDERGFLCGKILADLGVDVIKIEKPRGDISRYRAPFYHDEPNPESNLVWWAFNTSKRGITLDIAAPDGRDLFLRLVESADFVIESFQPAYMSELGFGYEHLVQTNTRVILVSITGFGQDGPYAKYNSPDIVCMAMGGLMNLTGEPDRPPLRITVPQAFLHASAEAAVGSLIALWYRERSGEGQWVDVSAQECIAWEGFHNQNFWNLNRVKLVRGGDKLRYSTVYVPSIFRCKDGYVHFMIFGAGATRRGKYLAEWMEEEGFDASRLKEIDWDSFSPFTFSPEQTLEIARSFEPFFLTKSKEELFQEALARGFLLSPSNSCKDVFEDIQLKVRDFWVTVNHEEVCDRVIYPGAPYFTEGKPYRIRRRAPSIGEHNSEIYEGELKLSKNETLALKEKGVI